MKNENIINQETRRYAKEVFNNSEEWKNFSHRITRNDFVRNYLLNKYHYRCQGCYRLLSNPRFINLHHTTYMHCCISSETIKAHHETPTRSDAKRKVPDCESCYKNNPDAFHKCTSLVVPVCLTCNRDISLIPKSKKGSRRPKSELRIWKSAHNYIIQKVKNAYEQTTTFPEFLQILSTYGIAYDESRKNNRFILSEDIYFQIKGEHSTSYSPRTKRGKSIGEEFTTEALREHFEG